VATYERRGINGSDARALLAQFERTLSVFEDDFHSTLKQQDKQPRLAFARFRSDML